MFIKRGAVAVALALALALASFAGSSRQGPDSPSTETSELAGGTWS